MCDAGASAAAVNAATMNLNASIEELKTSLCTDVGVMIQSAKTKIPSDPLPEVQGLIIRIIDLLTMQLQVAINTESKEDFFKQATGIIVDDYSDLVHGMNNIFYFDVSNVNPEWELVKAELRIFRNVTDRNKIEKGKKFLVSLYTVLEDDYNIGSLELVEDFILSTKNSSGWLGFNITKALMKWIEFPLSNSGLRLKVKPVSDIEVPGYDISPHDIGIYTTNTPTEYRAFIVAYFKSASQQRLRTKRTPRRKQLNSSYMRGNYNPYRLTQERYVPKTRSCEKWALYVNFRDLGFEDWIIAPDGYAAFYCDGSCMFPLNAQMNATNHAIVQTLMHLMDPNGVPKPSCAPTQLSSITVLYFDDNSNVILKKYKNMVVKSCGCH